MTLDQKESRQENCLDHFLLKADKIMDRLNRDVVLASQLKEDRRLGMVCMLMPAGIVKVRNNVDELRLCLGLQSSIWLLQICPVAFFIHAIMV